MKTKFCIFTVFLTTSLLLSFAGLSAQKLAAQKLTLAVAEFEGMICSTKLYGKH